MQSKKRGFTLIELLVVIAIIGLLASIVLASLNSARKKSRDARREADLKSVQNALELWANDNGGRYPATAADCSVAGGCLMSTLFGTAATQLGTAYMPTAPVDPIGSGLQQYYYKTSAATAPTGYCVAVGLENALPTGIVSTCSTVTLPTGLTTNPYGVGN